MDPALQSAKLRSMAEADHDEARRFTRKGQATRGRIVAVAAELMYEEGVTNTSVDDVQAAAGRAPAAHHYFGGKPDPVCAVVAHQSQALLDGQQPLLGEPQQR